MTMTPEERDRLTRVETKLDRVIEFLQDFEKLETKVQSHDTFIEGLKLKMGIVGGGFLLFGTVLSYLIQYIISHLQLGWGSP